MIKKSIQNVKYRLEQKFPTLRFKVISEQNEIIVTLNEPIPLSLANTVIHYCQNMADPNIINEFDLTTNVKIRQDPNVWEAAMLHYGAK